MPLGRTALWFCLGLGVGLALTGLASQLVTGSAPFVAQAPASTQGLAVAWPFVLAAAASTLLVAGTAPGPFITVPRSLGETLLKSGKPGLARIRRVSVETSGSLRLVSIDLDARSRAGNVLRSRLVWLLEPLDAKMLARGAVIPVRIDRTRPHRMVLDTRADSRAAQSEIDVNEEFSRRGIRRARLRIFQLPSRIALALGLAAGMVTALIG